MKNSLLILIVFLTSCAASDQAIKNKHLYCSALYVGSRAVGRTVSEIATGATIVDVCSEIDSIVENAEETADASTKSVE